MSSITHSNRVADPLSDAIDYLYRGHVAADEYIVTGLDRVARDHGLILAKIWPGEWFLFDRATGLQMVAGPVDFLAVLVAVADLIRDNPAPNTLTQQQLSKGTS